MTAQVRYLEEFADSRPWVPVRDDRTPFRVEFGAMRNGHNYAGRRQGELLQWNTPKAFVVLQPMMLRCDSAAEALAASENLTTSFEGVCAHLRAALTLWALGNLDSQNDTPMGVHDEKFPPQHEVIWARSYAEAYEIGRAIAHAVEGGSK